MDRVAPEIAQKVSCFSRTSTGIPARASSRASIMPAGPPPAMQQRTETSLFAIDVTWSIAHSPGRVLPHIGSGDQ